MFGVVVVRGAQVNPVMSLSYFHGFLPLVRSLVELVQEVVALAVLVQPFCIFLKGERTKNSEVLSGFEENFAVIISKQ